MNYRHVYHAGNFADVMKHIVLVRIIEHLKQKEKPFRFIDTHAGSGRYDLSGDEAQRTGEWRDGIGAILDPVDFTPIDLPAKGDLQAWLEPYLEVLRTLNPPAEGTGPRLITYPGAGEIARRLLRQVDRVVLNELQPADAKMLRRWMHRDERVRTLELDGWMAAKSVLPPKERRGILLVDPPFELAGEFKRLEDVLDEATDRFATGITLLWYPIKAGGAAEAFRKRMMASGHKKLLCAELLIRHRDTTDGLNGSGLMIHNPPYGLDAQLKLIFPWLVSRLKKKAGAGFSVDWIVGE